MEKILMSHLWNMGDGGWVEKRAEGFFLCSSYTSTKGYSRGRTSSSEKRLSEEEYSNLLIREEEYLKSCADKKAQEEKKKDEKGERIAAYRAVSPFVVGGNTYNINQRGEILYGKEGGEFVSFIPKKLPISKEEAECLLKEKIGNVRDCE